MFARCIHECRKAEQGAWYTVSWSKHSITQAVCFFGLNTGALTTAKLSVFKLVFVPILTYGHETWVMIERVLSQVQTADRGFFRKIHGVILRDKVRSCEIRKKLNAGSLLRIEISQLRRFGHVTIMLQEWLARQKNLLAPVAAKRPISRPRTWWCDYISNIAWSRLGVEPVELSGVSKNPWGVSRPPRAVASATPPERKSGFKSEWMHVHQNLMCWASHDKEKKY